MHRATLLLLLVAPSILFAAGEPRYRKISVAEYRDKVYASWLGQMVGNIYGLPHENRYIDQPGPDNFPYGYGANLERIRKLGGAFSDDDTDIEYVYLLAMEKHGIDPTYEQLAALWRYHMRDRIWIANRAALAAMHHGLQPPLTGRKPHNPHWFQIDPQLVNEIWAVTAPGMIPYAAAKSAWGAEITNEDWGIEPTVHYGAMFAAGFFEKDVRKLIEAGNAALPANSRFRRAANDMIALYEKYPNDWKKARAEMSEKYWTGEPASTKTIWNAILNGAAGVLALLYGQGDFQKTLDYACVFGFDADNQAATMSGLIALVHGTKGVPPGLLMPVEGWKEPFNDRYLNVSRYDMPDASIRDMAARIAKIGEKVVLLNGGRKVTEDGVEYLIVDTQAQFRAPLEIAGRPPVYLQAGQNARFDLTITPAAPPVKVRLASGQLPPGLSLSGATIAGVPRSTGAFEFTVEAEEGGRKAARVMHIVVTGPNLAPAASEILAPAAVLTDDSIPRPYRSMPAPWLTDQKEALRDAKTWGDAQTYRAGGDPSGAPIHFGYRWDQTQRVAMIRFVTGVVEETGFMDRALVEYMDETGAWKPVLGLKVEPAVPPGAQPFDKPHYAAYALRFEPVLTKAVRLAAVPVRQERRAPWVSLAELEVY
ncbi:MAG TPA: ADP-ribosylglycohydrolase family protein [Solibacterales bacterium]|nr:ADP-ribosylglycohydrolase family protein [Bryobacterales bacterium]